MEYKRLDTSFLDSPDDYLPDQPGMREGKDEAKDEADEDGSVASSEDASTAPRLPKATPKVTPVQFFALLTFPTFFFLFVRFSIPL